MISRRLLKSINEKNELYQQYLRSRTSDKLNTYKTYKNKLTRLLKIAKKQYYEAMLARDKNDIKCTWKFLNYVINRTKPKPIKM